MYEIFLGQQLFGELVRMGKLNLSLSVFFVMNSGGTKGAAKDGPQDRHFFNYMVFFRRENGQNNIVLGLTYGVHPPPPSWKHWIRH